MDITLTLWRRKLPILLVGLVGGILGTVPSLLETPVYQATATLLVTESKVDGIGAPPDSVTVALHHLRSRTIASQLVTEFGLDQPPTDLHPLAFIENNLEVAGVPGTKMIDVTVAFVDGQTAADLANRAAQLAIEYNSRVNREDAATNLVRNSLGERLGEIRGELDVLRAAATSEGRAEAESQDTSAGAWADLATPLIEYVRLYRRIVNPTVVQLEFEITRQVYAGLSASYQEAEMRAIAGSAHLQIIDPAIVAPYPTGGRSTRNDAAAGLLVGLIAAALAMVFYDGLVASRSD